VSTLNTILAAAAAGLAMATGQGTQAATPAPDAPAAALPAEVFVAPKDMIEPVLSPNGDALAVLVRNPAGRRELAIIDITHPDALKMNIAARGGDRDIYSAQWVDDTRLFFDVGRENESVGDLDAGGTFAVDRDGEKLRLLPRGVSGSLHDGSGDVVVYRSSGGECQGNRARYRCEEGYVVPQRLNTRTGSVRSLVSPPLPDHPQEWIIDGNGRALGVVTGHEGMTRLMVPQEPGAPWKEVAKFQDYKSSDAFAIEDVGADGRVYVAHTPRDAGPGAGSNLYTMDLGTGKLSAQPVVEIKGFDFAGELVQDWRTHRVLGANYSADADGTAWFDPQMSALQARVDAALPGRVNMLNAASCGCAPRLLVTSSSDRQPAQFYLFDRTSGALTLIGGERPAIAAASMARTSFEHVTTRDGLDLPVYVTRPNGKGPWPTVVVVHGGPYLRGWHWEWDDESQFLASRGYLVVKPESRGSRGYGVDWFTAGFRQWGLKMQDDVADATIWAARQGLADPKRVCIEGGSYGGYATLMGLVRYPELYRCGIASAAVTDINLMYDIDWSDADADYKTYGMPILIGDQTKDAEQLKATSPLQQAARITRPLMLAHGGLDRRVPMEHAKSLRDALESEHAPLTWVFYADEGHGWSSPANRADWFRRMETFLAANIGPGAPPAASVQAAAH
jgi:dienelactone hydrolase